MHELGFTPEKVESYMAYVNGTGWREHKEYAEEIERSIDDVSKWGMRNKNPIKMG